MNEKTTVFFDFLDNRKETVENEVKALAADGRKDESNMLKAKANIYDICKAVYNATLKKDGEDAIATAFPPAFDKITSTWRTSLSTAKEHNDEHKVMIEENKLAAVSEILVKFEEIF